MSKWFWCAITLFCGLGAGAALDQSLAAGKDLAVVVLSILILVVAVLTLWFTVPRKPKINVDRLAELNLKDLIFYIYQKPDPDIEQKQPTEYLFQLQVMVSNVGGGKAILTNIEIDGFRNDRGETIHLSEAPRTIGGMSWRQQSGWIDGQMHFQNIANPPPYILAHDEVVVIRFRVRRGINWGSKWNVEALKNFAAPFQDPITSAFGTVIWRRGGDIVNEKFEVNIEVEQQAEYVNLLKDLTHGFLETPILPEIDITPE